MRAGRLRKRVTFQAELQSPDGAGGYSLAWVDQLVVWGGLQPERGRERVEAGRLESALGGVLTIRSSSEARAITTVHRVLIDAVPYQIRTISNPDQRSKYLELVVERGVGT